MRPVSIVFVAILTVACTRRESLDTPTAVACPAATIPGVDSHEARVLGFTLRLPPGFVRESSLYCEHGGEYYVRGRDRIGYCMGSFGPSPSASAPGEEAFSLFGRAAVLRCVRRHRGWSAYIRPIGPADFGILVTVAASNRATLAELLAALRSARAPAHGT